MTPEEKCYAITGAFEGSGGFSNMTGSFDGMGISLGILQWNFGQGTLQPLLRAFYANGPQTFVKCCTVNGVDYSPVLLAASKMDTAKAVGWAKTIQHNNVINPIWRMIFKSLGDNEVFQHVQMQFGEKGPMAIAKRDMEKFGVKTERALALFFDIAVQNGGVRLKHELLVDKTKTGNELLESIARAVAACAREEYSSDVLSRKMCIVKGFGKVHGVNYNLFEKYGLTDKVIK